MQVMEAARGGERLTPVDSEEADAMITVFEKCPQQYEVRRLWDPVMFAVSIRRRGEQFAFLSYVVGFDWTGLYVERYAK